MVRNYFLVYDFGKKLGCSCLKMHVCHGQKFYVQEYDINQFSEIKHCTQVSNSIMKTDILRNQGDSDFLTQNVIVNLSNWNIFVSNAKIYVSDDKV